MMAVWGFVAVCGLMAAWWLWEAWRMREAYRAMRREWMRQAGVKEAEAPVGKFRAWLRAWLAKRGM